MGNTLDMKKKRVKILLSDVLAQPGSSEESQKDFLSEASIVAQFYDPNVIKLVAVVTQSK